MNNKYIELGNQVIMNTYNTLPMVIEKGEGCYLWDIEGKKYLDFVSGIAVNCLGYNDKDYIKNLTDQARKIQHCSNLYWTLPAIELGEKLVENSCFDKVFFCNSGTEAVEAALKLSRKYGNKIHGEHCYEIITMKNSFHGRTFGSVTATGQDKYQKGFGPLLPGISYVDFNNFDELEKKVSYKTCGIIIEPIQGEGGIRPVDKEFLQKVRKLCDDRDIVLIFDEVQSGIGRVGQLFAYQLYDVKPDVICLAKGLGGGFPIGAMMAVEEKANAFEPGDHASTFGGNPLACTAGITVFNKLLGAGLLEHADKQGEYLKLKLEGLNEKFGCIKDVRGHGLMFGIELEVSVQGIISKCLDKGLLLIGAGKNVIRFVPPLTIEYKEIDEAIDILYQVLAEV